MKGGRFVPCGRTDMLIVDFRNFANTPKNTRVISGFRSDVDENCALLGYYVASSGNSLPTFRDNLSIPSSRVENGCHATSVRNYHYSLRKTSEQRSSLLKLTVVQQLNDLFILYGTRRLITEFTTARH